MNKKIVISAVGVIIIILLICVIAFNKKDNTTQTPQAEQPNTETDVIDLDAINKERQEQEEELKEQDALMEAHDEATVEVTEITEDGEATLRIINEEAGIDEELVIHDATADPNGGIHGIDENGEAVYYDPNDNIKEEAQEDDTDTKSNLTEDEEEITNEQTDNNNAGDVFPGFGEVDPDGGSGVEPDPDEGFN